MATALLCSATHSNKRHDSVAQKDPVVARSKLRLALDAASSAAILAGAESRASASRASTSRDEERHALRHVLRLRAKDVFADVDQEIEKDRSALKKSIETKERSDANAIQGNQEADELGQAKAGNFDAISGSASIQKKFIHEQHWFIPGNGTSSTPSQ